MANIQQELLQVLNSFTGSVVSQSILQLSVRMADVDLENLSLEGSERLADCIRHGIDTFVREPRKRDACLFRVRQVIRSSGSGFRSSLETDRVVISEESDILHARTIGQSLIRTLGFSTTDQTKIVTVISELARNIFKYAGSGTITVTKLTGTKRGVEIVAHDTGPGIADVEEVMTGHYHSTSGLGIGLSGSRKLMDEFTIETHPGKGTTVTARKYLA